MNRDTSYRGFTIVELLIVIVVIGILAAITTVAFNGIQRRANNTATISAARSAITAVRSYIASNGAYPATSSFCLTSGSGCRWGNGLQANSSGSAPGNITAIASLPDKTPIIDTQNYGVVYSYVSSRTYNSVTQPLVVIYFLDGYQQDCQLPNITNSGGTAMSPAAVAWTASSTTTTTCVIHVSGP